MEYVTRSVKLFEKTIKSNYECFIRYFVGLVLKWFALRTCSERKPKLNANKTLCTFYLSRVTIGFA